MALTHKIATHSPADETTHASAARIGGIIGLILLGILIIAGIWWWASMSSSPQSNLNVGGPVATATPEGASAMVPTSTVTTTLENPPQTGSGMRTFTATQGGFILTYPSTWVVQTNNDGAFTAQMNPGQSLPVLSYVPDINAVALGTFEQASSSTISTDNGSTFTVVTYRPKSGSKNSSGVEIDMNDRVDIVGGGPITKGAIFYAYSTQDNNARENLRRTLNGITTR